MGAHELFREPNAFFLKIYCTICEKVIFAFERSYTTSAMRKSMLDVSVPGSYGKVRH